MKITSLIAFSFVLFSCCFAATADAGHCRPPHRTETVIVQQRPYYRETYVPVYERTPSRVVVLQEPRYVEEVVYVEEHHHHHHHTTYYQRPVCRPTIGLSFSWLFR